MTVQLHPEKPVYPQGQAAELYLRVEITAPAGAPGRVRPAARVALVLDASGSMKGEKLSMAKEAVRRAGQRLGPRDQLTLATFNDTAQVHLTRAPGDVDARYVDQVLGRIEARGGTDLTRGWLTACQIAADAPGEDGDQATDCVRDAGRTSSPFEHPIRCLLLTDGRANRGIRSPSALAGHAAELRRRGVRTSAFGVGDDFDEFVLTRIADNGGGAFHFVESDAGIPDLIARELGDALDIVARDVSFEFTAEGATAVELLDRHRTEPIVGPTAVGVHAILPDLVAGQRLSLVVRVSFGADVGLAVRPGHGLALRVRVRDGHGVFDVEGTEALTAATPAEYRDAAADDSVRRAVADRLSARARERALQLNRDGAFDEAAETLMAAAARIRAYADGASWSPEVIRGLHRDAARWQRRLSSRARKTAHYESSSMNRGRSMDGGRARWSEDDLH
jgi:Ca-activated chloride channel homolog